MSRPIRLWAAFVFDINRSDDYAASPTGSNRKVRPFFHASTKKGGFDFMAKKPKALEQDNPVTAPDVDILPEEQQPEQTQAPSFAVDNQPPEMTAEETVILEDEGKAALLEMGEELPDVGEAAEIFPDISEEVQSPEPIYSEAFKVAQEAASAETPAPEEQEDTRQEWEKPVAEIEAERQPSAGAAHRRPPRIRPLWANISNLARSDTRFGAGPNKQIFAENRNCGHSCPACRLAERADSGDNSALRLFSFSAVSAWQIV